MRQQVGNYIKAAYPGLHIISPEENRVAEVIQTTVPLSKTMAVQIDGLRNWAQGRARRASSPKAQEKLSRKLA